MNECMNIPSSLSLDQVSQHPPRSCLQQRLQQAEGSDQLAEPVEKHDKGTVDVFQVTLYL